MLSKIHCTCQDNTHLSKIHTLTLVKILLHYHAPALLDWSSAIMSTSTNMAEQALPPIVTDPSTTLLAVGAAADPPAAAMFTSREVRRAAFLALSPDQRRDWEASAERVQDSPVRIKEEPGLVRGCLYGRTMCLCLQPWML